MDKDIKKELFETLKELENSGAIKTTTTHERLLYDLLFEAINELQ